MNNTHQAGWNARASSLRLGAAAALAIIACVASSRAAEISIGIDIGAPPPPRHEVVVERTRPGPDYVWINGYWDGAPGHYIWVSGHWDRPPHGRTRWVEPRWERDHDGHYHMIKGEWR